MYQYIYKWQGWRILDKKQSVVYSKWLCGSCIVNMPYVGVGDGPSGSPMAPYSWWS